MPPVSNFIIIIIIIIIITDNNVTARGLGLVGLAIDLVVWWTDQLLSFSALTLLVGLFDP